MSFVRGIVVLVLAGAIAACGGSSTSPSQSSSSSACAGGNRGTMTARINGAAWTATCITTATNAGGILSLGATDGTQNIGLSINSKGLGDYTMTPIDPLNPPADLRIAAGLVNLIPASSATWDAGSAIAGSSGTLTLTALTSTGTAGTFSFTAVSVPGTGASGTKIVTAGGFNITF